jgi:pimeloyl-ACP methyl ester carboxylesterase
MRDRAASRWVDLDGPLHYVEAGPPDAPPMVLVHGLGGSHVNWVRVLPGLARERRVLVPDLVAHGLTPVAGRSTTVEAHRGRLGRFLVEVAGRPAVLVGNSMGALLGAFQAVAQPETVTALALLDAALPRRLVARHDPLVMAAFAGYATPRVGEAFLTQRRRRFSPREQVTQTLRLCCADPSAIPGDVVEEAIALARERLRDPEADSGFLGAARSLLRTLARPRQVQARLDAVHVPVLLVHGDADRLVPVSAARETARRHPHWSYAEASGVGHVPQLEAPDWTLRALGAWLDTLEPESVAEGPQAHGDRGPGERG